MIRKIAMTRDNEYIEEEIDTGKSHAIQNFIKLRGSRPETAFDKLKPERLTGVKLA